MQQPDLPAHLAIIRKAFTGITLEDLRLDAGWDHHVYIVNEATVFRFPQTPWRIGPLRKIAIDELAALGTIPFTLPTFEIRFDDDFRTWYEEGICLPGVAFSPAVAATFTRDEMMTIARQMGAFLTVLHAFPLERARELGMDEMDPTDFWDYMHNNPNAYPWVRRTLWPVLPPGERAWIADLFEEFIAQVRRTPLPLVIRHSDMHPYHIIVNPSSHELVGVIDFSWRIADPAGDFKAFAYYGAEFVDEVYAHYGLPMDAEFDDRRRFYTGHDEVFELVRSYQLGDAGRIAKHHGLLSDYIRAHPIR
jgi:aminoglycoside 2''-phosphotransferase